MRVIYAILVWLVFIGGVGLYMQTRGTAAESLLPVAASRPSVTDYTLRLQATFMAALDPFALDVIPAAESVPVEVRVNGRPQMVALAQDLEAGAVYRVDTVIGLHPGENEIYVAATPDTAEADRTHAVRLDLLRRGRIVDEKTLWSDATGRIAGVFRVNIQTPAATKEVEVVH
ncbi:MAG: hypothetical protein JXQ27_09315 [Acidobacteria bacterium]|nr:hypothetical protein [Acidobacteriota bacterium]